MNKYFIVYYSYDVFYGVLITNHSNLILVEEGVITLPLGTAGIKVSEAAITIMEEVNKRF